MKICPVLCFAFVFLVCLGDINVAVVSNAFAFLLSQYRK